MKQLCGLVLDRNARLAEDVELEHLHSVLRADLNPDRPCLIPGRFAEMDAVRLIGQRISNRVLCVFRRLGGKHSYANCPESKFYEIQIPGNIDLGVLRRSIRD